MYNNTNNKVEQQSEHTNTKEVRKIEHINNQNDNTQIKDNAEFIAVVIETALKPRSSLPSKFNELEELEKISEAIRKDEGDVYILSEATEHRLYEARLKIARTLIKNIDIALYCGNNPYILAVLLKPNTSKIIEGIEEGKKDKKPSVSKVVTHIEAVEFVRSLVEGDKPRSSGFAKDLKHAALLIAFRKSQGNPSEFVDVDEALNKVYASARRQGKKNGNDLGGKSNNPTKTACKALILETLLRMIDNHEYKFDVIIGEASNR